MTPAPSLFAQVGPASLPSGTAAPAAREPRDLMDLLFDGFYMVFLLRNRHLPGSADEFRERLLRFLTQFERGCQRLGCPAEDSFQAKFAFTALVDELALQLPLGLREAWELRPLQLELFGEQLAGERFFEQLEALRQQGRERLQVLEVFHMCLLLGFQGRYALEGSEKLAYLTARLGDEIAQLRGRRAGFAPQALAPDRIRHLLRGELPLWVPSAFFALLALLAFLGLRHQLDRQTETDLARHQQVVQLPAQTAHIHISLP